MQKYIVLALAFLMLSAAGFSAGRYARERLNRPDPQISDIPSCSVVYCEDDIDLDPSGGTL